MFRGETKGQKGVIQVSSLLAEKEKELFLFETKLKELDNLIEKHVDIGDMTSKEAQDILKEYMRTMLLQRILLDDKQCTIWVSFSLDEVHTHIQDKRDKHHKENGICLPFSMFSVSAERPNADNTDQMVVGMWCALGGAGGETNVHEDHAFRVRDVIYGDNANVSRDTILAMVYEIERYLYSVVVYTDGHAIQHNNEGDDTVHARFHTMVNTQELVVGYTPQ